MPLDESDQTTAFVDRDCSDFRTWRAAQHYFRRRGGPQRDLHPALLSGPRLWTNHPQRFLVLPPDLLGFDGDFESAGCESG